MLCGKYIEGRPGNRCGLSHKNRVHTTPSAADYHQFIGITEYEDMDEHMVLISESELNRLRQAAGENPL